MATVEAAARPDTRYRVRVEEYVRFHAEGFLVVRGLVPPAEVEDLKAHTEDIIHGRLPLEGVGQAPLAGCIPRMWRSGDLP